MSTLQVHKTLAVSSQYCSSSFRFSDSHAVNGFVPLAKKTVLSKFLAACIKGRGRIGLFASRSVLFETWLYWHLDCLFSLQYIFLWLPTQFSVHSTRHQGSMIPHCQTYGLQPVVTLRGFSPSRLGPMNSQTTVTKLLMLSNLKCWFQSCQTIHVISFFHALNWQMEVSIRHPYNLISATVVYQIGPWECRWRPCNCQRWEVVQQLQIQHCLSHNSSDKWIFQRLRCVSIDKRLKCVPETLPFLIIVRKWFEFDFR